MFKRLLAGLTLILALGCAHMAGEPLPPTPTSPAVQAIAHYEFGDSRVPLTTVEAMVRDSLNTGDSAIADDLAALLASESTYAARQFALRQLALIGSERHVDTIAPLLLDADLSHMARYALEPIPGGRVDRALLDALSDAPDALKPGIINSLAARGARSAAGDIRKLTSSPDPTVADTAKSALDKLSG